MLVDAVYGKLNTMNLAGICRVGILPNSIDQTNIDSLLEYALHIGATKAKCLSPEDISIEGKLALFCEQPKCPHWGLSMSCPPNVGGPAVFREKLVTCKHVIAIRIEVPASSLHGDERHQVFRYLHETVAGVEAEAKKNGWTQSRAFAGSSCKESFCYDHKYCRVLSEAGDCRHPDHARQSMSGFGVNVNKFLKAAGWSTKILVPTSGDDREQLSWVAGIVLLC